jgi:hypothetical protein
MSPQETFRSPLADALSDFVAFKRMQGYNYSHSASCLKQFDRFLIGQNCSDGLLRGEMFSRYAASTERLSAHTRKGRLSVVRVFSRFLHAYRPESAVVPGRMLPRHPPKQALLPHRV